MTTRMANDSLHQNLIVSVVVDHITTDGIKVSLKNSTIKCKIGWNFVDNDNIIVLNNHCSI